MTGYLIFCDACQRPIEGILVSPDVRSYRGHAPMADAHAARYGHYPYRAFVTPADERALRRVGTEV